MGIVENANRGWIGIYRSIKNHWLYPSDRKFTKYEAWLDLLLSVNHTEKEVNVGNELLKCKRGQKITSQKKLMNRWGWSKSKLISFLNLLKKDQMIALKADNKKTIITILNFQQYQAFGDLEEIKKDHEKTAKRLQKDRKKTSKRPQKDTNNKDKEDNNENNEYKKPLKAKGEKPPSLHSILKEIFIDFKKENFEVDHYWTPKDAKHLKQMIKKIKFHMKKTGKDFKDEIVADNFIAFLQAAYSHSWIKENFELAIINSKFDVIYQNAKQKSDEKRTRDIFDEIDRS